MSLTIRIAPDAQMQIAEAEAWWEQNAAPMRELFFKELGDAYDILEQAPRIGKRYLPEEFGDLRRYLLKKTRYHLYYRYAEEKNEIRIVAVWSASRGWGPKLSSSES